MTLAIAYSQTLAEESDSLYRKVVDHGYMEHELIAQELLKVSDHLPRVRRILDLGCGDAEVLTRFGAYREIDEYFAVDRSRQALDRAGARLEDIAAGVHLYQQDMLEFLWATSLEFDLILIGYALNALDVDEKRALLRLARTRLTPEGVLLVHDVFRQPGESRQGCLEGYARIVENDWTELHPSEIAAVKTHIDRCCQPEDLDQFCRLAVRAGLRPDPALSWTGKNPYHKLIGVRPA
jgi:SAM-dependent methyltransferase